MKILDLFCGAGGFSLGFISMGSCIGVDKWDVALETYSSIGETIQTDMLELDISTIGKIDVLVGSPPCQDFSTSNSRRQMDTLLVEKFLEIRDELNPEWWVMEEVPAVGKIGEEKGWFKARYLQANWFGLPHRRRRLFAGNYPRVYPTDVVEIETYTPLAQVRGLAHGKESWKKTREFYYRYTGREPPEERETIREVVTVDAYRKLMGFPEWFEFCGEGDDLYIQIGNAVCPPISKAIADSIKKGKRGGLFN